MFDIQIEPGKDINKEIELIFTISSDLDSNGRVNDADLELFMNYYWQAREGMPYDSVDEYHRKFLIILINSRNIGKVYSLHLQITKR